MSKFSVKKPFTVFVAVIAVLVLGVVSFTKMTPDLLPNMDFPYVMIMTTYPGASPEKVESEVTKPMEQAMATLDHIHEVSSTSSENYSMVMLEFEESVDLDIIGVDIQQSISTLSASWDDMVGTPYVLKINPSLLPVEVAAVAMEGMDTVQLTEFLNDTLMNELEGISGVARISTTGAVEQKLHVILDQEKIDALNLKIQDAVNGKLDEAEEELNDAKAELESAQQEMNNAQSKLDEGKEALLNGEKELNEKREELSSMEAELETQLEAAESGRVQLQLAHAALRELSKQVDNVLSARDRAVSWRDNLLSAQSQGEVVSALKAQIAGREASAAELEAEVAALEEELASLDPADPAFAEKEQLLSQKKLQLADDQAALANMQTQLVLDQASYEAALAALNVTQESLPAALEAANAGVEAADKAVETMDELLASQDMTRESLKQSVTEMEAQLEQLDAGIAQLETALAELEAGMLTLEEAAATLEAQKTAGLLELSSAAAQLAVGSASISQGLTQVESGLETLESSRETALEQADLNGIITMDTITGILTAQNFAMPAGYLEQDGLNYMVSVGDEITDQETLENLLLFDMKMEGVEPVYLKDVAVVMLTDNRNESYAKLNGQDGIVLTFEKQSTYATAETTDNINARFRELEAEYPGLTFVALMNQGDYIYLIVESILSSLLLGALFAIIILWIFLKDLRPTFITLCSIPISVIFAIVLMYFSGVTINMISLSGLAVAVGMLVDNSVVVIENIYRLRSKGANVIQAAVSGAQQVAGAVTASTLTTVCVFLPIVFVEGITKQLFTDLALTMTYSLMASLIVSLTLVPAMASGMLRKEKPVKDGKVMDGLLRHYAKLANWSLDHKAVVLMGSLALLLATGWASISKGFIFMPDMDMPNANVTITMPEGVTMEEAAALSDEVLARIDTVEGIETAGAMMSASSTGAETTYSVTVYITLSDENASGAAVGQEIVDLCADMPCEVSSSSAMMDTSMLTGSGVSLRVYAQSMEDLQSAAKTAAEVLTGVEGVASVSDGLEEAAPALHVAIDRNAAMAKGITVAQIYMELASSLTNEATVATLELDGTSTDVILEKPAGARLDLEELKNYEFEVTGQDGEVTTFLLDDVAEVEETVSLHSISRLNQQRYLSVTAELEPGYNVTLVTAAADKAMKEAQLPDAVSYVFTGENETIMEAVEQLLLMLVLGVLLVYLVMVAQFQSLKSPFIVMFTIPLAFTGGFMALLICGMEVSVVSLIGFVMLVGIIVNNGIVLVDYINQLRLEGVERRQAIVEAGVTRMRPILMTTITTILGLLDMAVRKSAGTSLMQPVAVVCIGGLLYATLMTLFVVPCIYDMVNKKELRSVREEDLKILDL